MPAKKPLSEDDLEAIVYAAGHGASIAAICREWGIGRSRCSNIIADAARGRAQLAEKTMNEVVRGSGGAVYRESAHFRVEEPPAFEATESFVPIITAKLLDGGAERADEKKAKVKMTAEETEKMLEATETLHESVSAIRIGSDDPKTVEAGLEALKYVYKHGGLGKGEVAKRQKKSFEAMLKQARHKKGGKQDDSDDDNDNELQLQSDPQVAAQPAPQVTAKPAPKRVAGKGEVAPATVTSSPVEPSAQETGGLKREYLARLLAGAGHAKSAEAPARPKYVLRR